MESLNERREQTIERLKKRNRITDGEIDNVRTLLVPVDGPKAMTQAELVTEAVSENAKTNWRSTKLCTTPASPAC
jgi:3-hydroxyacyl-CoA dehydrogenase